MELTRRRLFAALTGLLMIIGCSTRQIEKSPTITISQRACPVIEIPKSSREWAIVKFTFTGPATKCSK
jgi:hypothetical protein